MIGSPLPDRLYCTSGDCTYIGLNGEPQCIHDEEKMKVPEEVWADIQCLPLPELRPDGRPASSDDLPLLLVRTEADWVGRVALGKKYVSTGGDRLPFPPRGPL